VLPVTWEEPFSSFLCAVTWRIHHFYAFVFGSCSILPYLAQPVLTFSMSLA
jgi:hypothetical protein